MEHKSDFTALHRSVQPDHVIIALAADLEKQAPAHRLDHILEFIQVLDAHAIATGDDIPRAQPPACQLGFRFQA